jgi:pyruvate/2-oxoglutarate dehydrogenase complex dihydrolipoamide acyltransferase (E2) component
MRNDVRLPKLGETASEVVIDQWLVEPGDAVVEGQAIVNVETDKVTTDVEAPAAGTVVEILVPAGEEVATGTSLCVIES